MDVDSEGVVLNRIESWIQYERDLNYSTLSNIVVMCSILPVCTGIFMDSCRER